MTFTAELELAAAVELVALASEAVGRLDKPDLETSRILSKLGDESY